MFWWSCECCVWLSSILTLTSLSSETGVIAQNGYKANSTTCALSWTTQPRSGTFTDTPLTLPGWDFYECFRHVLVIHGELWVHLMCAPNLIKPFLCNQQDGSLAACYISGICVLQVKSVTVFVFFKNQLSFVLNTMWCSSISSAAAPSNFTILHSTQE